MTATGHDPSKSLPHLRRRWTKVFLLASVILVCGIVIGMAITFRVVGAQPMKMHGIPEHGPEDITQNLRNELSLNDEQAKAVLQLFKQNREQLETLRTRVDAEVLAQMESTQEKIHLLLNPEQKILFDKRFEGIKRQFRPGPDSASAQAQ
jgi:hypothetical protein